MRKNFFIFLLSSSLLLNLLSIYFHFKFDFLSPTLEASLTTGTWFISVILITVALFNLNIDKSTTKNIRCLANLEKLLLSILLIFAFIIRIYKIDHFGIGMDESYWLDNAYGVLKGTIRSPFGFIGDFTSNMLSYPVAFFLLITKNSYFASRLPGVFYSVFTMVFIFLFLKEITTTRLAFISLFMISTSIWDIHTQRLGFQNISVNPFLISGTMLFLFRGLKYKNAKEIAFAGILQGISINLLYVPSLTMIASCLYILYFLFSKKNKKEQAILCGFFLMTVFIVSSPTLVKIYKYPEISIGRHIDFVKGNIKRSKNNLGIYYYFNQTKLVLNDFLYHEDRRFIHGLWGSVLDPFTSFFLFAGIVFLLFKATQLSTILVFLNFLIMFIPIVVLYRTESHWREFGFFPTIYIFSVLGIDSFIKLLRKKIIKLNSLKILIFLMFLYGVFAVNDLIQYYNFHIRNEPDNLETKCQKISNYFNQEKLKHYYLLFYRNSDCRTYVHAVNFNKYSYATLESLVDINTNLRSNNPVLIIVENTESSKRFYEEYSQRQFLYKEKILINENEKLYSSIYFL